MDLDGVFMGADGRDPAPEVARWWDGTKSNAEPIPTLSRTRSSTVRGGEMPAGGSPKTGLRGRWLVRGQGLVGCWIGGFDEDMCVNLVYELSLTIQTT